MLSNASLFLALPFAYLFCESEGLPFFGNKRGLVARAKETILTLILLSFVIMGLMYILAALIDWDRDSFDRLISKLWFFKRQLLKGFSRTDTQDI